MGPSCTGHLRPRAARRRVSIAAGALVVLCSAVFIVGCAAREMSGVKIGIERLEQQLGALRLSIDKRIDTGGGDVNEPVTGWILAAGYAAVPIAFLIYTIAHRSRRFRSLKDLLRGRNGVEPA